MKCHLRPILLFAGALLLCSLVTLFNSTDSLADIIRVPADQPTIQSGIDAAQGGDTVLVADGVYSGPGNFNITFAGKAITVMSAGGPRKCAIDGGLLDDSDYAFIFSEGETRSSVLKGFTFQNFNNSNSCILIASSPMLLQCHFLNNFPGRGIALDGDDASPRINRCIFKNNSAGIYADGSPDKDSRITPYISNSLFANNSNGIFASSIYGRIYIVNCTFAKNSEYGGSFNNARTSIFNSIFYNPQGSDLSLVNSKNNYITNCSFTSSVPDENQTNFVANPMFVNAARDNYHLSPGSPAIDSGNTTAVTTPTDLDGKARIADGSVDIGAYEFQ